jgi:hypothetical protein
MTEVVGGYRQYHPDHFIDLVGDKQKEDPGDDESRLAADLSTFGFHCLPLLLQKE